MQVAAPEPRLDPNAAPLRVMVAGGGTGGHLYPGVAVARELVLRRPAAVVTFVGTARGIEAKVVPREGFALDLIRSGGLKGKSLWDRVRGGALVPLSLLDAWRVVSARRPDLVIGVGGYSSGPVVLVAAMRRVPTMLLEQNAVPGLTNRLLTPFVQAAAVTFDTTREFFGAKTLVTGNPVRPELLVGVTTPESRSERPDAGVVELLVFGGSQGAHAINVAMAEAAKELVESLPMLHVTHQTGERDVEMVRAAYAGSRLPAEVQPFLYDMGRRLAKADLLLCRSGATTLAEVTATGKAAILIPLPTATDDHQRRNAESLAAVGAAEVLLQHDLTGTELVRRVGRLVRDPEARARMAAAARSLARPDAARVIVDRALELAGA